MQQYCCMRTTVEIPDALLRQAKLVAVEQRTTLKDLIAKGLDAILNKQLKPNGKRLEFPLYKGKNPGSLNLTNEMIRQLEEEEDMEKCGKFIRC